MYFATIDCGTTNSRVNILNENLEIVGINLGGKENLLGQYISGMAMPSDRIIDFLEEWKR